MRQDNSWSLEKSGSRRVVKTVAVFEPESMSIVMSVACWHLALCYEDGFEYLLAGLPKV